MSVYNSKKTFCTLQIERHQISETDLTLKHMECTVLKAKFLNSATVEQAYVLRSDAFTFPETHAALTPASVLEMYWGNKQLSRVILCAENTTFGIRHWNEGSCTYMESDSTLKEIR